MNSVSTFIIYLTLFRLAIITAGVVSIVLGYRLFCRGIWPEAGSGKGATVDAKVGVTHFTLKNAAPGTCFALFGVIIITVMFASGSPGMTLNLMKKAAQAGSIPGAIIEDIERGSELSLSLRGDETDSLIDATKRGVFYEEQKDMAKAIDAYKEAIVMMATPMNHLAWLYQSQGEIDKALPLSRLAVQLCPDNADFLDTLAEIFFNSEDYSEALNLMEKAARLNSKYREKLERFREAIK